MAIVTITQAAKLVRRGRASLYRDISKGILSKTVSTSGESGVDTSELVRVYGKLYLPETFAEKNETLTGNNVDDFETKLSTWNENETGLKGLSETCRDTSNVAVLEEKVKAYEQRIELLERITVLEGTVRRDTVAVLKAQIADKETLIRSLENQILMLGYNKPSIENPAEKPPSQSWFRRLFRQKNGK